MSVTIKGSINHIRIAGELEFPPSFVFIYLDSFFQCEPLVLISADALPGQANFEITGTLPKGVSQIPRDARLMFQTYVTTVNDYGALCREDTGMTSVELFKMVRETEFKHTLENKVLTAPKFSALIGSVTIDGKSSNKNELRIQTNGDVKGTLHIVIDSISTTTNNGKISFDLTEAANTMENLTNAINMVRAYNTKAAENLKQFNANVKNTENITCFWYPSNVTFAGSATPIMMPLPTYLMTPTPTTEPAWWMQQLEILADRQDFASVQHFMDAWPSMSLNEKATYTMMLMAQYVQTLEYVSDRSNGKMTEMFGEALTMKSGDCEDLAKAIYKMIQAYGTTISQAAEKQIAALKEIYTIAKQYVYLFCLEGVSASHTQNESDFKNEIDGAHAAGKGIPRDYFGECIARGSPNHILGQETVSDYYKGKLPVTVLEGTGMLKPLGSIDGHEGLRKLIGDRVEALKVIKKTLYNSPTDSKFYKQIMLGATTEFLEKYGCATFYFSTPVVDPNTNKIKLDPQTNKPVMGKGVPYPLLAQRSPLVYLYPLEFNENVKVNARTVSTLGLKAEQCNYNPEFNANQLALMKSVARTCVPPPVFTAVNTSKVGPVINRDLAMISNPFMETLCNGLKALQPLTMAQYQKSIETKTISAADEATKPEALKFKIKYYINPQYLTHGFVNSLLRDIKGLNIVVNASYLLENHLDDYPIYRLTVEYLDMTKFANPTQPPQVLSTSYIGGQTLNEVKFKEYEVETSRKQKYCRVSSVVQNAYVVDILYDGRAASLMGASILSLTYRIKERLQFHFGINKSKDKFEIAKKYGNWADLSPQVRKFLIRGVNLVLSKVKDMVSSNHRNQLRAMINEIIPTEVDQQEEPCSEGIVEKPVSSLVAGAALNHHLWY
jgi:hypothetical protein